jgi:hypothetical protein
LYGTEYFKGDVQAMMKSILHELDYPCTNLDSVANIERTIKELNHKLQEQLVENDRMKKEMLNNKPVKIDIQCNLATDNQKCPEVVNTQVSNTKEGPTCDTVKNNTTILSPTTTELRCEACDKKFKKKLYLRRHESVCKGIDSLTCPTCFRKFNTQQCKWKHIKRGKCTSYIKNNGVTA